MSVVMHIEMESVTVLRLASQSRGRYLNCRMMTAATPHSSANSTRILKMLSTMIGMSMGMTERIQCGPFLASSSRSLFSSSAPVP